MRESPLHTLAVECQCTIVATVSVLLHLVVCELDALRHLLVDGTTLEYSNRRLPLQELVDQLRYNFVHVNRRQTMVRLI